MGQQNSIIILNRCSTFIVYKNNAIHNLLWITIVDFKFQIGRKMC